MMSLAADMAVNGMAGVLVPKSCVALPAYVLVPKSCVALPAYVTTKQCLSCGIVKPLSDFHARARAHDGVQGECKPCMCARARGWYARHKQAQQDGVEYTPDVWCLCHCPPLASLFADFDASLDGRRARRKTARAAHHNRHG